MNRERLQFLLSPRGRATVARAAELGVGDPLATLSALRRTYTPDQAAAALELLQLRERARPKFADARALFFEREALEQASGESIARWRARRFAGAGVVADLCCGIGSDALALAEAGSVVAVDSDRLRLEILRANAQVRGSSDHLLLVEGRLPWIMLRVERAFADPSRRSDGVADGARRRERSLERMSPPLSGLLELQRRVPSLGIKLSPALDEGELGSIVGTRPHELEFISDAGECREAVLWLGELVTAARRVTVLPAGETRVLEGASSQERLAVAPPGRYLYDPDPAVVRGHGVGMLGRELDAWKLHPEIAYLTSDRLTRTPLAAAFVVQEWLPFHVKRLRAALAARGYRDVVIKKRGFPMEPEALRRELRPHLRGEGGTAMLFVARVERGHLAVITERIVWAEE